MKYLNKLLAVVCMCAMFAPIATSLSCYKCAWTDSTCTMKLDTAKVKPEVCGGAHDAGATTPGKHDGGGAATTHAHGAPAAPAAPAAPTTHAAAGAPAAPATTQKPKVMRSKQLMFQMADSEKSFCFSVLVKNNGTTTVERGCKTDDKTDNCLADIKKSHPGAEIGKCTVCKKDKCNANAGAYSITGSALQCVVVSAILVGQIFLQAK